MDKVFLAPEGTEVEKKLFGPPIKVRILGEEVEYCRFDYVGRAGDELVLALITGAFPDGYSPQRYHDPKDSSWRRDKVWLAVVHVFDTDGNHRRSEARPGGTDEEGPYNAIQKAEMELAKMLAPLGHIERGDIDVKLFSVTIDGITHGLFYTHFVEGEYESEWVMLEPRDLMFHPPWDSGETSS